MGLFDIFKEANEDVHGARLERGMQDTMQVLATIDEDIRARALVDFIKKREKLLSNIRNMTSKGCIDMGRFLQDEARKKYDIDIGESSALWMAGAWLESMERKSQAAREVHASLNDLAEKLNASASEEQEATCDYNAEQEIVISPSMPDITKCAPIKWLDIGDYSAIIVKNAPNIAGITGPIEYLYVMALFSEESIPFFYVTAERGFTESIFLCTFDQQGNHSNYGADADWSDISTFAKEAFSILKKEVASLDDDILF